MGACDFSVIGHGQTLSQAFTAAVAQARYENGHGGYTGTIAEKHDVIELTPPKGCTPTDYAELLTRFNPDDGTSNQWNPTTKQTDVILIEPTILPKVRHDYARAYDDKWGPCAAVQLAPDQWLFFGLASS